MSGRNQWPAHANDGPKQRTYSCTCGVVSSNPINHTHSPYPTRPKEGEPCR